MSRLPVWPDVVEPLPATVGCPAAVAAPVGSGRLAAETGCVTAEPSILRPFDVPGIAVIVPPTLMPPSVADPGIADPVEPTEALEPQQAPVGRPEPPERFSVVAPAVSIPIGLNLRTVFLGVSAADFCDRFYGSRP